MKATVLIIVTPDDESENLERELLDSHILNNWPVFRFEEREATEREIDWYQEEYGE